MRIVSFEQTGSHYSKQQGYEYEGKHYFYKFNATTTVELNPEALHVKDWGYIYHDFYGVDKKISCANLGSNPYVDTRYAYYYDEPERTVELSPYIQYNGEDVTKGRKTTFRLEHSPYEHFCPDNNHPHFIDLGLPSGTKWCCCNEGAFMPHEYGGYYARGETSEKSAYTLDTYQYCTKSNNVYKFAFIGADISGTAYDPCKFGRMPKSSEFTELIKNTTREEVELNGVKGQALTSKVNGNKIFLPYTGYKGVGWNYDATYSNDSRFLYEGVYGNYWTSTTLVWGGKPSETNQGLAYRTDYEAVLDESPQNGLTVRAVNK